MEYSVKITGKTDPYADRERVIAAFAQMAKVSEEQARSVFEKAPVVIKKGLDQSTAEKFRAALERIGAVAEIDPPLTPPQPSTAEPRPDLSLAPKAAFTPAQEPAQPVKQVEVQEQPGYQFRIEGRPDYAFLTVQIPPDETLKVEASAMATMDTNLRMKTKLRGGLGRFVTGESIFVNEFTAEGGPGEIGIAPGSPGDMVHLYLNNETVFLQNSAFVAATMDVNLETKWQGLVKGFFSGESLFLIRASGQGDLWFNTYGAMIEIDVTDDYVVDTGNIVAFTDGLEYNITKVGGYKSLFFSGEGFVCRFKGKGKVWIQTRGVSAFTWWAHWYRPVKNRN
jgi:uncharacterized protein (TIGR00266 family)